MLSGVIGQREGGEGGGSCSPCVRAARLSEVAQPSASCHSRAVLADGEPESLPNQVSCFRSTCISQLFIVLFNAFWPMVACSSKKTQHEFLFFCPGCSRQRGCGFCQETGCWLLHRFWLGL